MFDKYYAIVHNIFRKESILTHSTLLPTENELDSDELLYFMLSLGFARKPTRYDGKIFFTLCPSAYKPLSILVITDTTGPLCDGRASQPLKVRIVNTSGNYQLLALGNIARWGNWREVIKERIELAKRIIELSPTCRTCGSRRYPVRDLIQTRIFTWCCPSSRSLCRNERPEVDKELTEQIFRLHLHA